MSLLKQLSRAVQALNRNRVLRSIKAITALLHHIAKSEKPRSQHRCMYPQRHQPAMTEGTLADSLDDEDEEMFATPKGKNRKQPAASRKKQAQPKTPVSTAKAPSTKKAKTTPKATTSKASSLSSRLPTVLQRVISHNPNINARPANAHMDRPDFAPHHPPQLRRL